MKLPAIDLRWQMSAAMSVIPLMSVIIIVASLGIYFQQVQQSWLNRLSLPEQRLYEQLDDGKQPSSAREQMLLRSGKEYLQHYVETHQQDVVTVFFGSLAASVVVSLGAGMLIAWRLASAVEHVADAAKAIAKGDLSQIVRIRGVWISRELTSLAADVNAMVSALAQADRELRDGNAAIAHELRTPLTVLRGRLQGIQDGVFECDDRQIAMLIGQVDDLSRIVEDLRVLSLTSAGAFAMDVQPIELGAVVIDAISALKPKLEEAGFRVISRFDEAVVIADAARVRQLILAVLDNCLRYAEGGDLVIEVAAREREAVLQILDRGPGFKPGEDARAFDRFWRSDQSRSRDKGGSGLGLSVVSMIAKAHGWTASIRNRHSGGAVFELRAPLHRADAPAATGLATPGVS